MATNEPKDHIMNFFTNTLLLLATVSLMSFGLQEEDPHIVLAEEYCGCVTRMGRIIPDPEQAMAGCLRNLHLGNPLFLAAQKAAHAEAQRPTFPCGKQTGKSLKTPSTGPSRTATLSAKGWT
jgi:hypothetical protein